VAVGAEAGAETGDTRAGVGADVGADVGAGVAMQSGMVDRPVAESDSGAPRVASAIVADTRPLPLRSTALLPYQAPHKLGPLTTPRQGSARRASVSAALHAMLWIAT